MMKRIYTLCFAMALTEVSAFAQDDTESSGQFAEDIFEAQVLLDRAGFSTGEIDGIKGRNVEEITKVFQKAASLEVTGELDEKTSATLIGAVGQEPVLQDYEITDSDTLGPFIDEIPEKMEDKAKLDILGYTDALELLGEKFHSDPELLKRLNPDSKFEAGETIRVPKVDSPSIEPDGKVDRKSSNDSDEDSGEENKESETSSDESETTETAKAVAKPGETANARSLESLSFEPNRDPSDPVTVTVTKDTSILVVEDSDGKPVFAAPVTTGSKEDPLPIGEWKVNGTQYNPPFNYNPNLFWDSEEGDEKAKIPPGANNPVGVAWIDLSKEHYGLHGTPEPGKIGHTESHGCVRLTNWDVLRVADYVKPGVKVIFKEK